MTRTFYVSLVFLAAACASSPRSVDTRAQRGAAADQGAFVVTLGRDTIAAERFRMTTTRLEGELVLRIRETVRRPFTMMFDAVGNVSRLEFATRRPTDGPSSAPLQRVQIIVSEDTIVMETHRNDSTFTRRIAAPAGTVPLLGQSYASYEVLTRRAVRAMSDSVVIPTWAVGAQRIDMFSIVRAGPDSVKIIAPFGTTMARIDAAGRIQGAHALGSTFKVVVRRDPALDLTTIATRTAITQLSPRDTVRAAIGDANFTITYSRPEQRGRHIFGDIVPWGQVWRTGANEATHFTTDTDLVIGGKSVPAGRYTLWSIPRPEGWTLIINKQTDQWGTVYDEAMDLIRVPMRDEIPESIVEQFTISLEPYESGAALRLQWADREAWLPFEIKK
jgi:hypothetical protein